METSKFCINLKLIVEKSIEEVQYEYNDLSNYWCHLSWMELINVVMKKWVPSWLIEAEWCIYA